MQHFILTLSNVRKMENPVNKGNIFGVLLTDSGKASDCLKHETLKAKLNGYTFSLPALKQVQDYLSNGK